MARVEAKGGTPERMTTRSGDISYPTPIDGRTVLYVARDENGGGPWLWALEVKAKVSRRVSLGLEQYTTLTAGAGGRRLVTSVVTSQVSLSAVPILDRLADERDVKPFPLPTARALAPRFGGGSLFYLSSRGGDDGLWSYREGQAAEIWKGSDGAMQSPPAVSPDGRRVAITLRRNGKLRMHVLGADGTQLRPLAGEVDVRGAASWSPGRSVDCHGRRRPRGPGLVQNSRRRATRRYA